MDQVEQEVDQGIGEFPTAEMAKRGQKRQLQRLGMAAQFIRRFHRGTIAVGLYHFRGERGKEVGGQRHGADPLELGNLTEEVLECGPARIGPELVKNKFPISRAFRNGAVVPLG
jgi:hypothetical protein